MGIRERVRQRNRDRQQHRELCLTIDEGVEVLCIELERMCNLLEDALPKRMPPGFLDIDGDFVYLGEVECIEEYEEDGVIVDTEGNEWHRVEDYE